MLHCPGQDTRQMGPKDVFELRCECGELVEFWPGDPRRRCPGCGRCLPNPRFDAGCAAWCRHAAECLESRQK